MKQAVNNIQKEPTIGFSLGTIHHNLQMESQNEGNPSKETLALIQEKIPPKMLQIIRNGGSAISTAVLKEPGYGLQGGRWDAQIKLQKKKEPVISYLYASAALYKSLGALSMCHTFNTHTPYLKINDLQDSIDSLLFMMKNTNVVGVTLGNENYLAAHILGANGTPSIPERYQFAGLWGMFSDQKVNKAFQKSIDKYLDYLEFTVVPAIRKSGYKGKIGLDVHNQKTIGYRMWNESVLSRDFYDFLTPHLYVESDTDEAVDEEFKLHFDDLNLTQRGKEIWVTEFGISSKAYVKLETIEQVEALINKFIIRFIKYGVLNGFWHTLYNKIPTIYTFIK